MGSFIGGLVTAKKRKKLNKLIQKESQFQTDTALEIADIERENQKIQQQRANVTMSQERISAAREARIRRAEIISAGVNAGGRESSITQSAAGSLITQFNAGQGLQNMFRGYAELLSKGAEEASLKQSEIISSQGRQTAYGAKLNTQQEKANLIGGGVDLGITAAFAFAGGPAIAGAAGGMFSRAASIFSPSAAGFSAASRGMMSGMKPMFS